MCSDQNDDPTPICTVDPYEYLQIKMHPDGTITRLMEFPAVPAAPDPSSDTSSPVITNDFPVNPTHKTFVRVYLPKLALSLSSPKLPVIVYCHGGGFVLLHADSAFFAAFCAELAARTPAIVVSVEYRLAPEHRLPAAYEDAVEALYWTAAAWKVSPDSVSREGALTKCNEWLSKYGDFSNCYLMGSSAGGNIAYHAALQVASDHVDNLRPLILKGLILHQPFFGGSGRTGSELRLANNPFLPLSGSDLFWELALPVGSGRDHEFCDPAAGGGSAGLGRVKELGWRVLATDCSSDLLVDRLVEFVKMLEEKGVEVEGSFTEGGYHRLEIMEPEKGELWFDVVKKFVGFCLD